MTVFVPAAARVWTTSQHKRETEILLALKNLITTDNKLRLQCSGT